MFIVLYNIFILSLARTSIFIDPCPESCWRGTPSRCPARRSRTWCWWPTIGQDSAWWTCTIRSWTPISSFGIFCFFDYWSPTITQSVRSERELAQYHLVTEGKGYYSRYCVNSHCVHHLKHIKKGYFEILTLLSREPYWPPPAVEVCISQYQPCCFPLPWDTNGRLNNTTIIIVLLLYPIIVSFNVSIIVFCHLGKWSANSMV